MLTQVLPLANSYQTIAVTNYHRTGGNLDYETWVSYTPVRYTECHPYNVLNETDYTWTPKAMGSLSDTLGLLSAQTSSTSPLNMNSNCSSPCSSPASAMN